jgi:hypothetical protein
MDLLAIGKSLSNSNPELLQSPFPYFLANKQLQRVSESIVSSVLEGFKMLLSILSKNITHCLASRSKAHIDGCLTENWSKYTRLRYNPKPVLTVMW